jgi:preprotein translocase subunit YajC
MFVDVAYAAAAPAGVGGPGLMSFAPIVLIILIFYFIVYRPQSQERKKLREKIENLKKGDRLLTSGGIYGTVVSTKGKKIRVKISDSVNIDLSKAYVSMVLEQSDEAESDSSK